MMAQQGKRVLLIGCDPKSDTTSLLFGGKSCPDHHRNQLEEKSSPVKKSASKTSASSATVSSPWNWVAPKSGAGCGGRGIIHGFELLEKLGFHDWGFALTCLPRFASASVVVCGGSACQIAPSAKCGAEGHRRRAATTCNRSMSGTNNVMPGGRIFPQDGRQCRAWAGMIINKG